LLPVSKGVSAERLRVALDLGLVAFGENRVQEAQAKADALGGRARWQLIGHLQSNKAARAVELFEAVHSVDSLGLAQRLDRVVSETGRLPLAVYLQVNVDADPAKAGFAPADLERILPALADLPGLRLAGLMTIGRLTERAEDAGPTFAALRGLSERLRRDEPRLGGGLSMGMSLDFEVAVEEGATVVRVGRALFGPRVT
jgi:pyridoxal phosphate enzyme (YggS family)